MALYYIPVLLCVALTWPDVLALQWTSSSYLENGTSIRACVDDLVTLNWTFTLDSGEQVDTVRWHYVAEGHGEETEAILASGTYLPLPGAPHYGRLQYVPNAGVQLSSASIPDTGTYLVRVNLHKNGAAYAEVQLVYLEVAGLDTCHTKEELLAICESENAQLTSQVQAATLAVQQQEQEMAQVRGQLDTCLYNAEPPPTTLPPPTYPSWFHPKNCREVKLYNSVSGVYTIYINDTTPLNVYCDQSTSGGEWLVIQRRVDGTTDFYRNWNEYENGFGDLNGEFWLGLKYISELTRSESYTLRVEARDFNAQSRYIEYEDFSVGSASSAYTLHSGRYRTGNMDTNLETYNGMQFTTYDRDHDQQTGNCAVTCHGAWWYKTCTSQSHHINLNGRYKLPDGSGMDSIAWYTYSTWYLHPLKSTEMKIRPRT